MRDDRFKAKLAAIGALANDFEPKTGLPTLRKALGDRSNFVVAKAANVAAQLGLDDLSTELIAAFERLWVDDDDLDRDGTDIDAGCRGKAALVQALKDLEHRNADIFLRGLSCVQSEKGWNGAIDTAGTVRATCAQALVACDLAPTRILEALVDRFVDADKVVRSEVALAIANVGLPECVLLLRLKVLAGDIDAEVIGQCFLSLIDLAPDESVAFVARFLESKSEDIRFEAVSALAQARPREALAQIEGFWSGSVPHELRLSTLASLVASPHRDAGEFLLAVVTNDRESLGAAALSALASSRFRNDLRDRVATIVETSRSELLQRTFERVFALE